ncbi:MAG: hypothetical protein ACOX6I_08150 [Syntrophomonadaceae bacterium]|jgi:hypothetical protein
MANLKCEFPEGCKLDLWAKVIKAKYIERQVKVLDTEFCVPEHQVNGRISCIEDIKVKLIKAEEEIQCFNRVKISFTYEVIMFVIVDGEYQIVTVTDCYEQFIELDEFDPPFTPEELRTEVESSEIILKNWSFDYDIKGDGEDPNYHHDHHFDQHHDHHDHHDQHHDHHHDPASGTVIALRVYVDIIDKLGKMHDIVVYGELDPETDY